jgi:hypothetical protein
MLKVELMLKVVVMLLWLAVPLKLVFGTLPD